MTKIFLTGATGYIGGDALYAIAHAHPEYEITALVRNTDKGARVAKEYASVRLVYGDLDSEEVIEKAAQESDIVCHFANADHEVSARAIIKGLLNRSSYQPAFYIHTSGTGVLTWQDIRTQTFGTTLSTKIYNDLEDVSEVTFLPDDAPHRHIDKIVLEAGTAQSEKIKTAIVCPPTIYGAGRGPDNKRSHQIPELCRTTLEKGFVPKVNEGKALWNHIHVHDLSNLYLKLVEEAAAGGSTKEYPGKPATWGGEGYYFCENGEHVWGEVSEWLAEVAKKEGLIESDVVRSISAEEAGERTKAGQVLWGANSRGEARRGKEVLGWEAKGGSLKEEFGRALKEEVERLGVRKGHAIVAAGDA